MLQVPGQGSLVASDACSGAATASPQTVAERSAFLTRVTPEGLLVGVDAETGRVLCALPTVGGPRYPIAAIPSSRRKARSMVVPRGVPCRTSPLGLGVVLHHEDAASRWLTKKDETAPAEAIQNAHPGLVAEYLANQGRWNEVEQVLLAWPCAVEWVRACVKGVQMMRTEACAPAEEAALQTLRGLALSVPARAAASAALQEIVAEQRRYRA